MDFDETVYDRSDILHSLDIETKQFGRSGTVHICDVINSHDLVRWPVLFRILIELVHPRS